MKAQRAGHTADSSPVDMLQSLPQAVVSFDAAGDVVFANHAARALFGAGALNVFRLAGNGPVADAARHVVRTGGPVTLHDVPFLDTQAQGVSIAPQAASLMPRAE